MNNPRYNKMFQRNVSWVINKVSNIFGSSVARAPTHDAYECGLNFPLTNLWQKRNTNVFILHLIWAMFTPWTTILLSEGADSIDTIFFRTKISKMGRGAHIQQKFFLVFSNFFWIALNFKWGRPNYIIQNPLGETTAHKNPRFEIKSGIIQSQSKPIKL
jgi:hypothetical protein